MVKERFHDVVRTALEKEGWQITAAPYEIKVDDVEFEIDLAAEQILAATRENQKIGLLFNGYRAISTIHSATPFRTARAGFKSTKHARIRSADYF